MDKLPEAARLDLTRLCASAATLREIIKWLAERHGVKTSQKSLSDWWKRRIAAGLESPIGDGNPASEITITVRVLPTPAKRNEPALEIKTGTLRRAASKP